MKSLFCLLIIWAYAFSESNVFGQTRLVISAQTPSFILQQDLSGGGTDTLINTDILRPWAVAVDTINQKLYWCSNFLPATAIIEQSNMDGTGRVTLGIDSLVFLNDIIIDYQRSRIIWTDYAAGKIMGAGLDGQNIAIIVNTERPIGLSLNCSNNELYWSEEGQNPTLGRILRINLDDSGIDTIASYQGFPIKLAFNCTTNKLFWTDDQQQSIKTADPDGTNADDFLTVSGNQYPFAITIDQEMQKLYWSDYGSNKVRSVEIGTGIMEDILTVNDPLGLALYRSPINPTIDLLQRTDDVNLFPNPVKDYLIIEMNPDIESATGIITDSAGRLFQSFVLQNGSNRFSTESIPPGLYLLQLRHRKGISSRKFIKI